MNNFNFLTDINGIYNYYYSDEGFNASYNLLVFNNDKEYLLKIKYKTLTSEDGNNTVKNGEIILKDMGIMEYTYLLELFNTNENIFKNIIFNKLLDYLGDEYNFDIIL